MLRALLEDRVGPLRERPEVLGEQGVAVDAHDEGARGLDHRLETRGDEAGEGGEFVGHGTSYFYLVDGVGLSRVTRPFDELCCSKPWVEQSA